MRITFRNIFSLAAACLLLGSPNPESLAQDKEKDLIKADSKRSPTPTPTVVPSPVAPSSEKPRPANTKTKVCLSKPQKVDGNLTPETFMDRLLTYFESEPELQIIPLENVNDAEQGIRRAVAANCEYLLRTQINGETKGLKIKLIGNRKYKIAVEYFLERLSDKQVVKTEKIEASNKDDEAAVGEVIGKIASGVFSVTVVGRNPTPAPQPSPGDNNDDNETSEILVPRLVVQTSHASSVTDFSYSKDGRLLATLGADGVLKIWLVRTKQEIITIAGYDIVGFVFHPNGKQIACVSKNSIVRLIDVATGKVARRFYEIRASEKKRDNNEATNLLLFNNPVPITFTQTGRLLVVGKIGGVRVIDVPNGTSQTIKAKDEDEVIDSLSISPNGESVATVIEKNKIKIWSLLSLKEKDEFKTGVEEVTAIAFSRDGSKIAIGSLNGSVKTFFVEKGKKHRDIVKKKGDTDPCDGFAALVCNFVPGVDIVVRINNLVDRLTRVYKDESIRSLDFSPDGKTLAYHSGDNSVQVVDIENTASIFSVPTENKPVFSQGSTASKFFLSKFFKQLCPVKFSSDGGSLNTCRELRNIQRWNAKTGESIETLAVSRRGVKNLLPFPIPFAVGSSASFLNERMLITSTLNGGVKIWDLESGSDPIHLLSESGLANIPLSTDGRFYIANLENGKGIGIFELESRKQIKTFEFEKERPFSASFSPDGKLFAVQLLEEQEEKKRHKRKIVLSIRDVSSGNELSRVENISPNQYAFSPDSKKVAYIPNGKSPLDLFINKTHIKMLDIATAKELYKITAVMETGNEFISKIAFSSDGKTFAAEDKNTIKLWETETGKQMQEVSITADQDPFSMTFVPNRNIVTFTSPGGMYNWNVDTNLITKLPLTGDLWGNLSYSPKGKSLIIGGAENRLKLIDAINYKEVGSLVSPDEQDWLTVTPEGRFDAARLEDVTEVHWAMPDNPLEIYPLEIFMRDYYEPRLFGRLVAADTFAAIPDLSKRNRSIPNVEITDIVRAENNSVRVTVTARNTVSETQFDGNGRPKESGIYSLRLLRDGQLVGYSSEADETPISTDNNGKVARTFTVKLPNLADKKQVEFSAYAFNSEQIKSLTTRRLYDLPPDIAAAKGKAYLVTVGANTNEVSGLSLNYAANDAREMQKSLSARMKATGKFDEIIEIPLISDFAVKPSATPGVKPPKPITKKNAPKPKDLVPQTTNTPSDLAVSGEHNAKKAKIKGVIDLLSGRKPAGTLGVPNESRISKAGPNDLVMIAFSGHGYADKNGVFYMVPSDLGGTGGQLPKILERSISSNEFALWVRDLDAGEFLLILDACYAAAFVETGYKPGPMDNRGVGQLSYNKGIKILAATQENNKSLEYRSLQHGILSYVLINEGIAQNLADYSPTDNIVTTAEWLGFGVKRVPIKAIEIKPQTNSVAANERLLQQPKLFNFSRNRKGGILFAGGN